MNFRHLLFLFTIATGCIESNPDHGDDINQPPSFNLLLLDSVTTIKSEDIPINKTIVFVFVSTDCPYCSLQTDKIAKNIQLVKDIQFYIISNFPFETIKQFYRDHKLDQYPNIVVAYDYRSEFVNQFQVKSVPFTVMLGKRKQMIKILNGVVELNDIREIANADM